MDQIKSVLLLVKLPVKRTSCSNKRLLMEPGAERMFIVFQDCSDIFRRESGRPSPSATDQGLKRIREIIDIDCHLTVRDVSGN